MNNNVFHKVHPKKIWLTVEQNQEEPYRLDYNPSSKSFIKTKYKSLIHLTKFQGVYGWINGTGTPPNFHFDAFLFTDINYQPGQIIEGIICGMYFRNDGDHKFIAIDNKLSKTLDVHDIDFFPSPLVENFNLLYPTPRTGEGWLGAKKAVAFLKNHQPSHN